MNVRCFCVTLPCSCGVTRCVMSRAARVFARGQRFEAWMMMARQLHITRRATVSGPCDLRERRRRGRFACGCALAGQLSIDRHNAAAAGVSPVGAIATPASRLLRITTGAAGEGPARTTMATFCTSSLPALVASSVADSRSDSRTSSDARWAFVDADATGERVPTRARVRFSTTKKTDGLAAEDLLDVSETRGRAAVGTDKPVLWEAGRPGGRHPRYLRPEAQRLPAVRVDRSSRSSIVGALDCTVAVVRRVDVPPPRRPALIRGHHFGGSVTPPAPHYADRAVFFLAWQ